jgi:hypothetical protein
MLARRPALQNKTSVTASDNEPSDYARLRAKIRIDKNDLDTAVVEQPEVFLEISEAYSSACSIRDAAKDTLARADSELAAVVRRTLEAKGMKDTKDNVSDGILLHPDRVIVKRDYDIAVRTADMWGDLKFAFEQRMRMLRELVQLYAVGYFTTRSMKGSQEENRTLSAAIVRDKQNMARDRAREQRD